MDEDPEFEETVDAALRALAIAIRRRRVEIGLPQEELAQRSGLHRTYISDIERGARNLSFKNLYRLAHALETDCAGLLALSDTMCNE